MDAAEMPPVKKKRVLPPGLVAYLAKKRAEKGQKLPAKASSQQKQAYTPPKPKKPSKVKRRAKRQDMSRPTVSRSYGSTRRALF